MTHEQIVGIINQIFVEQFELDPAELSPEKTIFEDFGLDSLDIVDLITALQRKFAMPLRDNAELRSIRTLGDIYNLFEKLAKENPDLAAKIEEKLK